MQRRSAHLSLVSSESRSWAVLEHPAAVKSSTACGVSDSELVPWVVGCEHMIFSTDLSQQQVTLEGMVVVLVPCDLRRCSMRHANCNVLLYCDHGSVAYLWV